MRDQTISDRLDVTPREAAMLERLAPATRFKPRDPGPPAPSPSEIRACAILERRARIAELIAELGRVPSLRDMGERLERAGIQATHQTLLKDYRFLKIQSNRTRTARADLSSK
jgi:hypothetical protein